MRWAGAPGVAGNNGKSIWPRRAEAAGDVAVGCPKPRRRRSEMTSFSFLPSLTARSFTSRKRSFGRSNVAFSMPAFWFPSILSKVGCTTPVRLDARLGIALDPGAGAYGGMNAGTLPDYPAATREGHFPAATRRRGDWIGPGWWQAFGWTGAPMPSVSAATRRKAIAQGGAKRNPGTQAMIPRPDGADGDDDVPEIDHDHGNGSLRPSRARNVVNGRPRGFDPGPLPLAPLGRSLRA